MNPCSHPRSLRPDLLFPPGHAPFAGQPALSPADTLGAAATESTRDATRHPAPGADAVSLPMAVAQPAFGFRPDVPWRNTVPLAGNSCSLPCALPPGPAASRSLDPAASLPFGQATSSPDGFLPPARFYGGRAVLTVDRTPPSGWTDARTPVDEVLFQGLVILLAIVYVHTVSRYRADIVALISSVKRRPHEQYALRDSGSMFTPLLRTAFVGGVLATGLLAGRLVTPFLSGRFAAGPLTVVHTLLPLGVAALFGLFALVQVVLLWTAGQLTLSEAFVRRLRSLRSRCFAIGYVVLTPPILLYVLTPPSSTRLLFVLIALLSVVWVLVYLRESYALFIKKKVSISYWFLYLCAVEILPAGTILALLART